MDFDREGQEKSVKELVLMLLNEINTVSIELQKYARIEKYLRMDLNDICNGRLDRIAERHMKDKNAVSLFTVVLDEADMNKSPYYKVYKVLNKKDGTEVVKPVNSAMAKHNAPGTYVLSDNSVINFR